MWRVGIGFDSHRFAESRPLILGGVTIPHSEGLAGHSDADVLIHAIGDALLGAVGASDMGTHFPDTDPVYRGISSLLLLQKINEIVKGKGYRVENVDAVVVIEKPKIARYVDQMKKNVGQILGLKEDKIGIKAKTNEGMGFIGRGEGVASMAVVTVVEFSHR
ncbi:MAG: 2-C-methyl-D-erythritol 2,4-cyclodiphosphate synthase [Syntrophales bacterium]|nr:2-C-methyl-D-erythritol 2,4-cyclodiphosphate synthase [Syntrophales bacterium]